MGIFNHGPNASVDAIVSEISFVKTDNLLDLAGTEYNPDLSKNLARFPIREAFILDLGMKGRALQVPARRVGEIHYQIPLGQNEGPLAIVDLRTRKTLLDDTTLSTVSVPKGVIPLVSDGYPRLQQEILKDAIGTAVIMAANLGASTLREIPE